MLPKTNIHIRFAMLLLTCPFYNAERLNKKK